MTIETPRGDFYQRIEHRINWLTLVVGAAAAIIVSRLVSVRAGSGVAIGACLIWLHYLWLRGATRGLVQEAEKDTRGARASNSTWIVFRSLVGYALIAIVAYVIVTYFRLPIFSILGGLLALGAAAMIGSLYAVLFDNH
jgi:hypothetical protein